MKLKVSINDKTIVQLTNQQKEEEKPLSKLTLKKYINKCVWDNNKLN